jgi:hypothetical protein
LANDYYNLSPDAQELAHINFGLKFFDIMGNEITDASIIKQL